jgi:RNA 2',3'-cyclic 3'-phosphodiesterase
MSSEGFIEACSAAARSEIIVRDAKTATRPKWSVHLLSSTLHMRLFVALDIDQEIRHRIASFMGDMRGLAPAVRWVQPESLHVTLKFIGERPDPMVKDIENTLRGISPGSFQLAFRGAGFFPTAKSARVFWIGIQADATLAELAAQIERSLVPLGIEAEKRAFSPHLTLARAGNGSGAPGRQKDDRPNQRFSALQTKLSTMPSPDFGTMSAAEFFLYRSQLSSRGAQYTKIARFPLSTP